MPLCDFQVRVATLVLGLPEATEFALAGGAALIMHDVTDRATRDLDCFGPTIDAVDRLCASVVDACAAEGLRIEVDQSGTGFARLQIADDRDTTLLDLGYDPAFSPPIVTVIGAVRALDDLAGDERLALFSRAAPRGFLDVAALLRRYSRDEPRGASRRQGPWLRWARLGRSIRRLADDPPQSPTRPDTVKHLLAEREGFEPSVPLGTVAFKATAFVRSATVPAVTLATGAVEPSENGRWAVK